MEQLDLFSEISSPVRYLTPQELVDRGYCISLSDGLHVSIPVDANGNVTKEHPRIQTSVQQQWKINFN